MRLLFACGHLLQTAVPLCVCGCRVIERIEDATPRIVGTAAGPHVQTVALPAVAVSLSRIAS